MLSWNQVLLYPQGAQSDEVTFKPSLRLPAGWKYGTALATGREPAEGDRVRAGLPDDAGRLAGHCRRALPRSCPRRPGGRRRTLHIAADSAAALAI